MDAKKQWAFARKIMPTGFKRIGDSGSFVWTKRGGYADRTFTALRTKRAALGFQSVLDRSHGCPDGSVVGSATTYRDANGNVLIVSSALGVTRHDNYFRVELQLAGEPDIYPENALPIG
jgi:hypothetical protein